MSDKYVRELSDLSHQVLGSVCAFATELTRLDLRPSRELTLMMLPGILKFVKQTQRDLDELARKIESALDESD